MPSDELYPPVAYSWWVPALGVLLVLLVVAWFIVVLWRTRRVAPTDGVVDAPRHANGPSRARIDPYRALRDAHLARLDDVARRRNAGEISSREAHLELSAIARSFGTARTGIDMTVLTVREVRALGGAIRMSALLERLSPGAFAPRSKRTVSTSIGRARAVIDTW
ncbi:hypothetical protein [Pengzhenrongella frigida]|uniref:Uncharacterized protein n=1 Tax=Pengzhenrongella frigida TaxID=1259133 RepID=A0A4Q5N3S1_9MICO|nr:hypothetical protein [Cellulomonas sp. HLT2-17]RYV52816.1 hypothetical protein EUA98_00985 [Cellulomonas sp. HLT2-17]